MTGRQLAMVATLATALATSAPAQAGVLQDLVSGNGGADPFNKNNKLGVVVKLPQAPPPSVSKFDDPVSYTLRVDHFGNVTKQTFGSAPVLVSKIPPKEFNDGVRYFQLPGQAAVIADKSLWDWPRINHLQQEASVNLKYQQEQVAETAAKQQIAGMQQTIENTPYDQMVAEVQQIPDQQLIEARVRLDILIQLAKSDQIADTSGFERLMLAIQDEAARRKAIQQQQLTLTQQQPPQGQPQFPQGGQPQFPQGGQPQFPQNQPPVPTGIFAANLGIFYTQVANGNGTFGARLTGPPQPGSPAANLGLELGDMIFELDGQTFDQPSDVLAHRYQTEVGFIDVRSGQEKHYNIYIP